MLDVARRWMACIVLFCLIQPVAWAQPDARQTVIGEGVPWTRKDFAAGPDNFHFAVLGDRTGGHRPGVFTRAMAEVNLLQPAFVVTVGDLIEGYTEDTDLPGAEWDEVDAAVNKLDMPFFYTVGNHDMGNEVMRELWHRRLGRDYYHFVYRGILFLSLNTEDPPVALPADALAGQTRLEAMMRKDPEGTQAILPERSRERGAAAITSTWAPPGACGCRTGRGAWIMSSGSR